MSFKQIVMGLLIGLMSASGHAESVPNDKFDPFKNVVKIIVPYAPGGPTDVAFRIISEGLNKKGLKTVVVNRPGAEGLIGTNEAFLAEPDGYTIFQSSMNLVVFLPSRKSDLAKFTAKTKFEHLRLIAASEFVLAVNTDKIKATNLQEFISEIKVDPSKYKFSGGTALSAFVGDQTFNQLGLSIKNIPYAGQAPAMLDLLEGSVPVGIVSMAPALAQASTGKIRILASFDNKPVSNHPGLQSFKSFSSTWKPMPAWIGISAPPNTPKYIVNFYSKIVGEVVATKEVSEALTKISFPPINGTPEELQSMVDSIDPGVFRVQ